MQNVVLRRFLYACVGCLAVAGLLYVWSQPANPHSNKPHATSVSNTHKTTGADTHATIWECIVTSSSHCLFKGKPAPPSEDSNLELDATSQTGTRRILFSCSNAADCNHNRSSLSDSGYFFNEEIAEWSYANHRDKYTSTWAGCPPEGDAAYSEYTNPDTSERWGKAYRTGTRTSTGLTWQPDIPTDWPHCQPPTPTLTVVGVSGGSAVEGSPVCFNITMSHAFGTVTWSTGPGTGVNAAAFSGANKDLDPIRQQQFPAYKGTERVCVCADCQPFPCGGG